MFILRSFIFGCFVLLQWIVSIWSKNIYISNTYNETSCVQNYLCPNVQSALNITDSGDEILIYPGIYSGSDNNNICIFQRSCNFTNVQVHGLGQSENILFLGNNSLLNNHAFYVRSNTFTQFSNLSFSNFGNKVNVKYDIVEAAAIYIEYSQVELANLYFSDNFGVGGAGLACHESDITIKGCTFTRNYGDLGGAMYLYNSNFTSEDSIFSENNATAITSDRTSSGGAILFLGLDSNFVKMHRTYFYNNTAQHRGGAMSIEPLSKSPAYALMEDCIFDNNRVTGTGTCLTNTICNSMGGALYMSVANVTIQDTTFSNNHAIAPSSSDNAQGGAIFTTNLLGVKSKAALTKIHGCSFIDNMAMGNGGAILFQYQKFEVVKSIFHDNRAVPFNPAFSDNPSEGGAIWYLASSLTSVIEDSTFTLNFAISGWGGALFTSDNSYLTIRNCSFDLNQAISSYTNAGQGGALMLTSHSSVEIYDSTFESNRASPILFSTPLAYSGSGGAIFAQSSSIVINNTNFIANHAFTGQFDAGSTGGAILLEDCSPATLDNVHFTGNGAPGYLGSSTYASCGSGGAIYIKFSAIELIRSHFEGNWASAGGTQNGIGGALAVFFDYSSVAFSNKGVNINDTVFVNNTAIGQLCVKAQAGDGGAIGIVGVNTPPIYLNNVNFSRNLASSSSYSADISSGGAILISLETNLTARNCHFQDNAALFGVGDDLASVAEDENENNHIEFHSCHFSSAFPDQINHYIDQVTTFTTTLCEEVDLYIETQRSKYSDPKIYGRRRLTSQASHDWEALGWINVDGEMETSPSLSLFGGLEKLQSPVGYDQLDTPTITKLLENYIHASGHQLPSKQQTQMSSLLDELHSLSSKTHFSGSRTLTEERTLASTVIGTALNPSMDTLVNLQPDVVVTCGTAIFSDPIIKGNFHMFFGNYDYYLESKDANLRYSRTSSLQRSKSMLVGNISVEHLIITIVEADIVIDMPLVDDALILQQVNIFNGTLNFTNDIIVNSTSYLYESTISGITFPDSINITALDDDIRTYLRYSNMTFNEKVITGYAIYDLLHKTQTKLVDIIHNKQLNVTTNSTSQAHMYYDACNIIIAGEMIIDSPFRSIDLYSVYARDYHLYSNSLIYFSGNATLTVYGLVGVLTSTTIQADTIHTPVIYNHGIVSLPGTTESLFNQAGVYFTKETELSSRGSLTSILTVFGEFIQSPQGQINIVLNQTEQTIPVINLISNKSMSGTISVAFYTQNGALCPNLVLYDSPPSQFTTISFLETSPSYENNFPPMKVLSPAGLAFASEFTPIEVSISGGVVTVEEDQDNEETNIDSKNINLRLYQQQITIENIGCDYIEEYYSGVATAEVSNSMYPCHICLMNTSCELCGNGKCGVKGSCGDVGVSYSSSCCTSDCNSPYGTCEPNEDFTDYSCHCSSWFYSGNDCRRLSIWAIIIILLGSFVVVIAISAFFLYNRSILQKKKVLDELRDGILRHTESANNEYIQNMQQALILNDVFVKFEEIKLESKVGEGSFGVVHKATFRGAQVAVKQMRSMFFELTEKEIEEFRKEAYMMSRLRHPNIVLVMGISLVDQEPVPMPKSKFTTLADDDGGSNRHLSVDKKKVNKPQKTVCIITEFLEQGSLADILYGPTKLPAEIWTYELILTCALQAARGMLYLHSHQPPICHRDLKSSNLVVDDHWVVKVTDFGMSRIVPEKVQELDKGIGEDDRESLGRDSIYDQSGEPSVALAPTSSISGGGAGSRVNSNSTRPSISGPGGNNLEMTSNLGTTAWCAPELLTASSRTRYSIKVDVYSFGMVLWELWEKKRPFDEYSSRFDIMDAIRAGKRPTISDNCPPTFKALIKRCWHTDPSRRPTFNYIVRYLKDELARVKRNKTVSSAPSTVSTTSSMTNFARNSLSSYFRPSMSSINQAGAYNNNNNATNNTNASNNAMLQSSNNSTLNQYNSSSSYTAPPFITNPLNDTNNRQSYVGKSSAPIPLANPSADPEDLESNSKKFDGNNQNNNLTNNNLNNNNGNGDDLQNLPEGRTPLVKAFDRSLSYLTESPSVNSPLQSNFYKYGASNAWRDRYVMKFSGWHANNPDNGLPPPLRTTAMPAPGTSPITASYSPDVNSDHTYSMNTTASSQPLDQMMLNNNNNINNNNNVNNLTSLSIKSSHEISMSSSMNDESEVFALETGDSQASLSLNPSYEDRHSLPFDHDEDK